MARQPKSKPIPLERRIEPDAPCSHIAFHLTAILFFLGASAIGFYFLRHHVERKLVFPTTPPNVVLKDRPVWMSDHLAAQITKLATPNGAHSAFDHQLLIDTYSILRTNPWIKSVRQVRRAYGEKPADTIEIDCEFRAPIALVRWNNFFWLVDGDCVKLPEAYTAQQVPKLIMGADKQLSMRIIEGVKQPPAQPGATWQGEDLAAGIEMVKLLFAKPYAQEIVKVDVSNFAGRRDPKEAQLVLITRYNTAVRWGHPISAADAFVEVSPAQKLKYLQAIYDEVGRVDGNYPWIDIRFDVVTYPSVEGNATQANSR